MTQASLDRVIVALSCIGLAVMAGCAGLDYTTQAMESDSKAYAAPLNVSKGRAIVNVLWVPLNQISDYCGKEANACTYRLDSGEWQIVTEPPRSWNDSARLRRVGHELAHVFNGRHE